MWFLQMFPTCWKHPERLTWNLQITHLKKGKWSEPNLHDYGPCWSSRVYIWNASICLMVWCNFSAGWDYTKYYNSGDQVLSEVYGHPTNWRIKPIYISKTVTIPVGKSMQTNKYLSTPQMNWKSVLLRFQVDTNTSPQILQSENSPTHGEKTCQTSPPLTS